MCTVTSATAAAPVRLVATALAVVSFLAFLAVGRADGAQRSAEAYLAPEAACASASDADAAPAVQARAIACLVNWARAQDRHSRLVRALGTPARRGAQGRARRSVRAVLAHALRDGGDVRRPGVRLPVRDLRREPLRGHVGQGLRARRRARVAPVPSASREPPGPRGSTTSAPLPCAQTACSAVPTRSSGQQLSAPAASAPGWQESGSAPGMSRRGRGEPPRRDALRDPRGLRAARRATRGAGAPARSAGASAARRTSPPPAMSPSS